MRNWQQQLNHTDVLFQDIAILSFEVEDIEPLCSCVYAQLHHVIMVPATDLQRRVEIHCPEVQIVAISLYIHLQHQCMHSHRP